MDSYFQISQPLCSSTPTESWSKSPAYSFEQPDPIELEQWIDEKLDKLIATKQREWSIDFVLDVPCVSGESDLIITSVPADTVPSFYRPRCYSSKCSSVIPEIENRAPKSDDSPCKSPKSRLWGGYTTPPRCNRQTKITSYMPIRKCQQSTTAAKAYYMRKSAVIKSPVLRANGRLRKGVFKAVR